jgi:glycosyltransferase involved in cell wall biosynthesis
MIPDSQLVSIIITCFNQSHYLADAIESARAQTVQPVEILVMDDGSIDSTAAVARSYQKVLYIYQRNQGTAAARNAGLRASSGAYVTFLDADDRLLPTAVGAGLACLRRHPESGFVFGRYHKLDACGAIISAPNRFREEGDYYRALLQGNVIGMQSTVLYPKSVLEHVGGFDRRFPCCEDYDLYLRIAREFPAHSHDEVIAEYRMHGLNRSRKYQRMLETTLKILNAQALNVLWDPHYDDALRAGISNWRMHYGRLMVQDFRNNLKVHGFDCDSLQRLSNLARSYPKGIGLIARNALRDVLHRSLGMGS